MNTARELSLDLLVAGRQLDLFAVAVDGRSEVMAFLQELVDRDQRLFLDLRNVLRHIAEVGYSAPNEWLRRLHGWEDQWEIRKGDHRFVGFLLDRRLFLCLYRVKRRQSLDREDFRRVDRLRKEWLDRYE
jgi:mRNA-degrading endonuclease RelE of RelBE toxin-antitoxin system